MIFFAPRRTRSSTEFLFFILSSRAERSVAKDLVYIHLFPMLCVTEIFRTESSTTRLRFALDDNGVVCSEGRQMLWMTLYGKNLKELRETRCYSVVSKNDYSVANISSINSTKLLARLLSASMAWAGMIHSSRLMSRFIRTFSSVTVMRP